VFVLTIGFSAVLPLNLWHWFLFHTRRENSRTI